MRSSLGVLLLSLCMLLGNLAHAVEVDGLYQVSRQVADRGETSRLQAFRKGLEEALVRVSGHSAVLAMPEVSPAMKKPGGFIQGFAYRTRKVIQHSDTVDGLSQITSSPLVDGQVNRAATNQVEELWLDIQYDRKKLERLLVTQGQPVWSNRRPLLLFWTAVDIGGGRQFVSGELAFGEELRKSMLDAATERGLPVVFPLYDLQDRSKMAVSDFWGGFYETLGAASARYSPDYVVAIRGSELGGKWNWRWQLFKDQRVVREWTVDQMPQPAMAQGVAMITEYLADLYAIKQDLQPRQYQVFVTGLESAERFAQAELYLSRLGQVEQLELLELVPGGALIEITLLQQWPDFLRSLKLDQRLTVPEEPSQLPAVPANGKILQWTL